MDPFRPRCKIAQVIYDAFALEASNRSSSEGISWLQAEQEAVLRAAQSYAHKHALYVPDLADIQRAEQLASGHCDYGAKWATAVAETMLSNAPRTRNTMRAS